MELDSFKTILLRKAEGNKDLQTLVEYMGEEVLINSVVDALEKMAKPTHLTGTNANGPVTSFGANLDRTDVSQLRDALGHHLSHYKAALKEHHAAPEGPQKEHMRQVADKHLEHVLPLMHLAARASAHSKGKLGIDYPPLAPWETNYTTLERNDNGRFKRDAKLLRARPAKSAREGGRGIKDYRYFEMPPHPGHDDVGKMPHTGGYPWEDVQVGAPQDIDSKKAYLPIEDVADKKDYSPHSFDQHPIRGVQDVQADHLTPEAMQGFAGALSNWRSGEHHKKWLEDQKAKYTADKEGFTKRGHTKPAPFYEGIPLQEQPAHVHSVPKKESMKAKQEVAAETPMTAAPSGTPAKATPPTVRKPAEQEKEHPLEPAYRAWQQLPKEHKDSILQSIPGFREYVAKRGGK